MALARRAHLESWSRGPRGASRARVVHSGASSGSSGGGPDTVHVLCSRRMRHFSSPPRHRESRRKTHQRRAFVSYGARRQITHARAGERRSNRRRDVHSQEPVGGGRRHPPRTLARRASRAAHERSTNVERVETNTDAAWAHWFNGRPKTHRPRIRPLTARSTRRARRNESFGRRSVEARAWARLAVRCCHPSRRPRRCDAECTRASHRALRPRRR